MNSKIIYLGTSISALEIFCKQEIFDVKAAFCEKKRLTESYIEIAKKNKIKIVLFNNKDELNTQLEYHLKLVDLFIIYQFDFIIPYKFSSTNIFFNFHSGSLKTNRGAHPIIRSILNGDSETELTLHKINENIDEGEVIGIFKVEILNTDDVNSIKQKTEVGIVVLLNRLLDYLNGKIKGKFISNGKYYKPINENDYTINLYKDTYIQIYNKIRSQKYYKGAILIYNNKCYYINSILRCSSDEITENKVCLTGNIIQVYKKNEILKLFINKNL